MPIRILHIHSTFSLGGKEARAVRLMNAFGDRAHHTILSAVPGALGARDAIDPTIRVDFPQDHPPLVGKPAIGRYRMLARYMRGFDLVLTYNWGAMDAVGARRLFAPIFKLPPLIHHEDGFNQDEVARQKPARVWFRRLMLPTAKAVVVPSDTLAGIARTIWKQPAHRVHRIANGIPLEAYAHTPAADAIPGFVKTPGRILVGTVAGLRAVKNIPRLVRAAAAADVQLVIVGEGPDEARIRQEADRCGADVFLSGFLPDPARFIGLFDIFALSSDSEQQPISLIEAMAAGLPAVATDVGDIGHMIAPENAPFIIPVTAEDRFAEALATLGRDPALRWKIGATNRAKALQIFDESAMIVRYRTLYADAIGRQGALG